MRINADLHLCSFDCVLVVFRHVPFPSDFTSLVGILRWLGKLLLVNGTGSIRIKARFK